MTREEFKKMAEKGVLLLDGGTGTWLIEHGMPQGVCPEVWVLEHPEVLLELQKAYADAGSNMIMASTFGANPVRLKGYGKDGDVESINREIVALGKQAVGEKALVAGDMSMTGVMIFPDDDESFEEAVEAHRAQAQALADAGVDYFAIETMISLEDARAALKGIREVSDLPVTVTMTFEANQRTLYGDTPERVAEVLTEEGADAIGANCGSGPLTMLPVIETLAKSTHLPIIAKPNAGLPKTGPDGKVTYDLTPEEFAAEMKQLKEAGASILGGCCVTTPDHIRKLAEIVLG